MIRVKTRLDHKKIRCLIWLVLTLLVLFGYSLQSASGSAYYSMLMQDYATVGTPPVILQNGTAGTSTIYTNNTSAKVSVEAPLFDYVDNNDPDLDSSADKGMHSNFPAQQAGPDSTYDTLTEENTEALEDYVDNDISDVDGSTDLGSHSNFENQKTQDSSYDTVTEDGGSKNWGQTSQLGSATSVGPYRYMGGTSPNLQGMTITKVHVYVAMAGKIAIGVWIGGTLDNPVGATKRTESYDVSVTFGWNEIDVPDYNWSANTVTWIGWTNDGTSQVVYSLSSSDSGDFQSARGRWSQTSPNPADASVSMPNTVGAGAFSNYWYSMYIEYDVPYEMDLEVQFTDVIDFLPTERLCIYAGALGAEDLNIDFWNGTGWENLGTDLTAYSCNEYIVSLTSTNFTIRFRDETTNGDTTQDQWQIDASLLRVEGAGSKGDTVDQQSNVDGSADKGIHSGFSAQQSGPDSVYDALTEEDASGSGSITYENSAESYSAALETSHNFNYSLQQGSGNDRLVVVTVSWEDAEASASISSLTFGGTAMTKVTDVTVGTGYSEYISLWYLLDSSLPSSPGSYNIAVTVSEIITREIYMAVAEYSGVKQSAPDDYDTDANTVSGDTAITLTSAADGSVAVAGVGEGDPNLLTNTNNIENLQEQVFTSCGSALGHHTNVGSGNITLGWNDLGMREGMAGAVWQPATWFSNYELDLEVQWTDVPHSLPNEELCIYGGTMGTEDIKVDVWNGSSWVNIISDMNASDWNNVTITSYLTSNTFTIRFKGGNETGDTSLDTWNIDVALIHVWYEGGESYELNLEVQWTSADYTRTNEELCIKTGAFSGSENIQVKVWNNTGSSWNWVMNLTASQWNNVSITSYLTSSTFTVQFSGGTETGDTSEDSWNIDATILHVWTGASTWLGGWDKRVRIAIDHNDIDSDLSDSPVLVYLSNSSGRNNDDVTFVFDEVGSNRKKIAVTKSDGTTQCYVEIEKWDDASEQAWLWVKVPSISSTADTDLYLYYDSSQADNTAYVGDKESTAAQNVWDTSFRGVWHLDEDPSGTAPQMRDSTSNNNDGTSNGNMISGDQIAGKIDGSLYFDGTDDYIQTTSSELKILGNFTLSVWFKADSTTDPHHILWQGPESENGWGDGSSPSSHEMHLTICKFDTNNTLNFFYGYEESGNWTPAVEIITPFSDTTNWNHAVVVMTGAGTSPSAELFLNGVSQGTDTGTQTNRTAWNTNLRIGRPGADQRYFDGVIDEACILETAKSASWIKASYESGRDDLLDFGAGTSLGTSESTYDHVLRVNNTVTDSWQVRLKKYSDSNVSRLEDCAIYFHNSTDGTSNQIIIEKGSFNQTEGPWYDLGNLETIYIAMTVEANGTGTSRVRAYLEIRVPNTTIYAQYVITFEIA